MRYTDYQQQQQHHALHCIALRRPYYHIVARSTRHEPMYVDDDDDDDDDDMYQKTTMYDKAILIYWVQCNPILSGIRHTIHFGANATPGLCCNKLSYCRP